MVRRRPQVLTDRDDVAPTPARSARHADDLVVGLTEADHDPRLGDETRRLGVREHRQAPGVAGRRTHGALQAGDRLEVVVEHVGPDVEQQPERVVRSLGIGDQRLDACSRGRSRIASTHAATCAIPPSARSSRATIVSTVWSRSMRRTASATRAGSSVPAAAACACRRGRSRRRGCSGHRAASASPCRRTSTPTGWGSRRPRTP